MYACFRKEDVAHFAYRATSSATVWDVEQMSIMYRLPFTTAVSARLPYEVDGLFLL